MLRYLMLMALFLVASKATKAQSIHLADLIKLANLSHSEAKQFMIESKRFKIISLIDIRGQAISQYSKSDLGTSEIIIKSQWQDTNVIRVVVHYDVKPTQYSDVIIEELKNARFKLISNIDDGQKKEKLYDNGVYSVSIYTFRNTKLPASLELRSK